MARYAVGRNGKKHVVNPKRARAAKKAASHRKGHHLSRATKLKIAKTRKKDAKRGVNRYGKRLKKHH